MLYNSWKNISRTYGASEAWGSIILAPLALEGPHLAWRVQNSKSNGGKPGDDITQH